MQHEYGKAVVKHRTNPQHYAELARYLRMEYGPGTGPGYFLKEVVNGTKTRKGLAARAYNALASALKDLANAGRKSNKSAATR